jgi:hypothetical protein
VRALQRLRAVVPDRRAGVRLDRSQDRRSTGAELAAGLAGARARARRALIGATLLVLAACSEEPAGGAANQAPVVSDFLRFVEHDDGTATLETAMAGYVRADGARVDLIAAVHLGDRAYFAALQERFAEYDALLYELVAPEPGARPAKGGSDSFVSAIQRFMSQTLELEFQLQAVDYSKQNFVHADLTTDEFARLWTEKGESLWKILLRMMAAQYAAQQRGEGPQLSTPAMLMALVLGGKERANTLKRMLAREFENIELLISGLEPSEPGKESVLLGERNKAAIRVLERELRAGKRSLAIYYGGAHMPDLEARLQRDLGFARSSHEWVVAWRMPKRAE